MALINPIAIIKKWANGTTATADVVLPPVATSNTVANQEIGFPPSQEQDPTTGGQYVKRAEMNGVFKLYSEHVEFINKGGSYTFNSDIANAGGYSQGATLWSDYYKRFVTSLKDNNIDDFITDISKIDGVSWGFTEISDYINVPEIPITGDLTTNGAEIVVYCGKKQFTNNGLFNAKIKFALKNSGDYGAMYSLSFMGNPFIGEISGPPLLINYSTNILLADNYTDAKLEIKTYGCYLGSISKKPADYIFIVLKVVAQPTGRTDWQNPFTLSDVCIEGLGTILPVIGKTVAQANNILGTASDVVQNKVPNILYFPSITDSENYNYIDILTNNFLINGYPITRTKKITALNGSVVGNIIATKINFKQNPADDEIVYSIHCDFVIMNYPSAGFLYMPTYGVDAANINFAGDATMKQSYGTGSIQGIGNDMFAGFCSFVYSNQNIPEKNKISWYGPIPAGNVGIGRFSITFYANNLNNNF